MGHCKYAFNQSEMYQRNRPGTGIETVCGALTFPAVDDPELVAVRVPNPGSAEAVYQYVATGKMLARSTDDPHCPVHGGSPEPAPPPVTMQELQAAHDAYLELCARFEHDQAPPEALQGVPLPALQAGEAVTGAGASPVTADQLAAASEALAKLATRAQAQEPQEVTDEQQPHNDGLQAAGGFGLTQHPTVWTFAMVLLLAVVLLAVLRHFFGSIKVDFGTK